LLKKFFLKLNARLHPVRKTDDAYFTGLSIANSGMLHEGNLYLMEHAIKNLPGTGATVEIGSFCGLSTNAIAYLLRKYKYQNPFFSCDPWDFEEKEQSNLIYTLNTDYESYCSFIKESFIRNVKFFSGQDLPHSIQSTSDNFFEKWSSQSETIDVFGRKIKLGGPISFAFVDGNHQYDFVKRDFENIDQHLVKGGFILFDDSADHYKFGSARLMKEIKVRSGYSMVKKNPNYLFQKIISKGF
jgi:hypothetical protein